MPPHKEILDALGVPDDKSADRKLATDFSVELIAAMSARHVVERALARPEPLLSAIDDELALTPTLVGPVPRIAKYLGQLITDPAAGKL